MNERDLIIAFLKDMGFENVNDGCLELSHLMSNSKTVNSYESNQAEIDRLKKLNGELVEELRAYHNIAQPDCNTKCTAKILIAKAEREV